MPSKLASWFAKYGRTKTINVQKMQKTLKAITKNYSKMILNIAI